MRKGLFCSENIFLLSRVQERERDERKGEKREGRKTRRDKAFENPGHKKTLPRQGGENRGRGGNQDAFRPCMLRILSLFFALVKEFIPIVDRGHAAAPLKTHAANPYRHSP